MHLSDFRISRVYEREFGGERSMLECILLRKKKRLLRVGKGVKLQCEVDPRADHSHDHTAAQLE